MVGKEGGRCGGERRRSATSAVAKAPHHYTLCSYRADPEFSAALGEMVVQKLKCLKKPFRKLLYDTGHIHENVKKLHFELDVVQRALDFDPSKNTLREEEAVNVQAFIEAILLEEMFLRQKAKIDWLREGDSNSAYFHKAVKSRVSQSRINVVSNSDGVLFENEHVPEAFVAHYEAFLGHPGTIKNAMFSMGNEKSPGPDGFTAAFFKEDWDIVGKDVILAVREFFINGKLLKEMNHTIIALIPKVSTPARVNDFWPISCCNVLFKCISKIIANRIKSSLKVFISPNQSAFVPGRSIADNILLTQEIMHNYHLNHGTPRCAFKVDIQKAYDTVDWCFLRKILMGFGFHDRMVGWIMECVTTTSFSICVNGSLHGYFKGKRGLRQGDPLSPYLFTLVMEILTLIIKRRVRESDVFAYHRYCSKLDLVNLCFADDLFLFAHGNTNSARVIMESLEEFKIVSGLVPSLPKSTAYFCNVTNHVKMSILQILPFEEGRLPVKYLGVPLVSSRLIYKDCKELFEKVQHRVDDWKNKSLSIAGRLQLVNSVIGSLHVFWASVFMLPTRILLDIEQIMRGFLWCNGKLRSGKAKVAWEVVCLPKDEGGLGIRRLDTFNKALMTTHVWKLLTRKESLWVQWIHAYKLRGRSFWDVPYRGNMSWGWRNILKLRPLIRDFIWHKIGDGSGTSVWFDRWCEQSPLAAIVTSRDIFREGFSSNSKVCDLVRNGSLLWPPCWLSKYPSLFSIPSPTLVPNSSDTLEWRDESGFARGFSAHVVWNTIRHRNDKVDWCDVVWFSCCIPRHAVHLWLVLRRRLKTQDQLRPWDATGVIFVVCPLCETQPDSHDHLFFECVYSQQVWHGLKALAGLPNSSDAMDEVVSDILPFATRRTSKSIIAKLVVAATSYFIWQERNGRLFKNSKRTVNQVVECIMHTVRLKLLSCRFKTTRSALEMINAWNLSESILY
ncbi:putative RNA-directed DNA polymerase, eukaryota, reverse transcriptase zinc-binding domain protein [Tanacetum coccineum]